MLTARTLWSELDHSFDKAPAMQPLVNVDALRELVQTVVREELERQQVRDDYLTVADAAAVARVKPPTIREWVRAGRLPATRIGRRLRITRADLDAAITGWNRGSPDRETVEVRARRAAAKVLGRSRVA